MIWFAAWYYIIGVGWLASGFATGWLRFDGDPRGVALWFPVAAAVWPLLVCRILCDLKRGQHFTDMSL